MKNLNRAGLLCIAGLLGGCASSSPIQRYGESPSAFGKGPVIMSNSIPRENIYQVYQRATSGFTSINSLREEVEERANTFCERQGKGMLVLGEKTSHPPYILGNFPRIEVVFAAVDKTRTR